MPDFSVGDRIRVCTGEEALERYHGAEGTIIAMVRFDQAVILFDSPKWREEVWHTDWLKKEDPFVQFVRKTRKEAGLVS